MNEVVIAEKKTQGGNVFKTRDYTPQRITISPLHVYPVLTKESKYEVSLSVMLTAFAVGNILALGNLQEATEKKCRELHQFLKGPEDSRREVDDISE